MFEVIIGSSPALQRVLAQVAKVATTDSTVLILGETGTGKELVARAIHKRSRRSSRAFIRVNCPAIPASLIDRKSTRLNSSHGYISYAVFCLKKKTTSTGSRIDRSRVYSVPED